MALNSEHAIPTRKGSATPVSLILVLTLATAPFFGGASKFGFYSVEWSYFAVSFVAIYIFAMWLLLRGIGIIKFDMREDEIYRFFIVFFFIGALSLVDAPLKTRGLLFLFQYVPYIFSVVLMINFVRTENHHRDFMKTFYLVSVVFTLIVIAGGLYFGDRVALNVFMLRYLNISVNKVLPFMELPFCVALTSILMRKESKLQVLVVFLTLACITATASRGSLLVLVIILILTILFTRKIMKATITVPLFIASVVLIVQMGGFTYSVDRVMQRIDPRQSNRVTAFSKLYTGRMAIETIKDHPVNGIGIGNLAYYSEQYYRELDLPPAIRAYWSKKEKIVETTSSPLRLGAELGIGGILFFLVFYFHLWRRLQKGGRVPDDDPLAATIIGHKIFIAASFFHNFVDAGFSNYYTWFYYGSVIALANLLQDRRSGIAMETMKPYTTPYTEST